jgi:excisionase family DNA binding protein
MQAALSSPKLVTVREAAGLLGCSTWTIRRWIAAGSIHAVRLTPKANFRIPLADLERILAADPSGGSRLDGASARRPPLRRAVCGGLRCPRRRDDRRGGRRRGERMSPGQEQPWSDAAMRLFGLVDELFGIDS